VSKVRHFTAAQHGMPCAFAFQESPQNPQLARGIAIDHRTIDKVSAIFWWNWPTGSVPTPPKIGRKLSFLSESITWEWINNWHEACINQRESRITRSKPNGYFFPLQ
jgi:hypothetical protein